MNIENLYKELFDAESYGFKSFSKKIRDKYVYFEIKSNTSHVQKTFILSNSGSKSNYLKPIAIKLLEYFQDIQVILLDLPVDETSTSSSYDKTIQMQLDILKQFSDELNEQDAEIHFLGWDMDETTELRLDLIESPIDNVTILNSLPIWSSVEPILNDLKPNNKIKKVKKAM